MSKKKIAILFFLVLFLAAGFFAFKFFSTEQVSNAKISGIYLGNQVWSGEIIITGDTEILGNLTVLPGTTVKFAVGDDQKKGDEVEKMVSTIMTRQGLNRIRPHTQVFLSCKS